MRIKIDALTKGDWLEGVVRTTTTELHAVCERAAVKADEVFLAQQEYNELEERIDWPVEETQESAPPPAPPAVSTRQTFLLIRMITILTGRWWCGAFGETKAA